jgi:BTB/POZ domain-containing protein KCTD9
MISCDFYRADFELANLNYVHADSCIYNDARFYRTNCAGGQFVNCSFNGANFQDADLQYAQILEDKIGSLLRKPQTVSFVSANCSHAVFVNYNLTGARFESAKLDGAKFVNVDLTNANFKNASFKETEFSNVTGLTANQLLRAKTLYHAKLSPDLVQQLKKQIEKPPPEEIEKTDLE